MSFASCFQNTLTFGLLGLGLAPAGSTTTLSQQLTREEVMLTQPLLHILSGSEAGTSEQSGLLLVVSAPTQPGTWGLNPPMLL